jgi:hypothetical protein
MTNERTLTIRLIDTFANQDITMTSKIGVTIDDMYETYRCFSLAAGFHPDTVKEVFDVIESQ